MENVGEFSQLMKNCSIPSFSIHKSRDFLPHNFLASFCWLSRKWTLSFVDDKTYFFSQIWLLLLFFFPSSVQLQCEIELGVSLYRSISHRRPIRWKLIMICCRLNELQNVLMTSSAMKRGGRSGCTASLVCIACGISPGLIMMLMMMMWMEMKVMWEGKKREREQKNGEKSNKFQ